MHVSPYDVVPCVLEWDALEAVGIDVGGAARFSARWENCQMTGGPCHFL